EGQQGTEPGEAPCVTPPLHRDLALALAGLVWAAAFVGPAAVAVGTLGALADRYAYLALFGFALAVTTLVRQTTRLSRLPLLRTAVLAIAGLWVALLLFVSHREVGVWANNRSLYTHAVTVEPNSAIAHYRLGVLFGSARRWPEAVAAFARAAALNSQLPADVAPTEDRVLNNLGVAHLNLGQITEAERSFRQAIDRSGNVSYRAWFNLAEIAWSRGDRAEACRALSAALSISPKYRAALAAQAARCAPSPPDTNVAP
ncbi:MAG TPA: tetratricopeptide repeat protein, partial [Polyangia bacterium]